MTFPKAHIFGSRTTIVLAFLTILSATAQYISPSEFSWMPFLGLMLPAFLGLNFIFLIYWIIRKQYWFLLPLGLLVSNLNYISEIYQIPLFHQRVDTTDYPQTLNVATYNIDGLKGKKIKQSYKEIAAFLKSQHVDIVCFQELCIDPPFTLDSLKAVMSHWPYCFVPEGKILQIGVFSKYPINPGSGVLVAYPATWNCSMFCDIRIDQHTIRLFNNHLQTTEINRNMPYLSSKNFHGLLSGISKIRKDLSLNYMKRATQAEEVQKRIYESPFPTLVCGDFNSTPSSYVYSMMKGENLHDGFQTAGSGYMYTYRKLKGLLRIDYILHSDDFKGVSYYSPNLDYSDHKPVIMKMRMKKNG